MECNLMAHIKPGIIHKGVCACACVCITDIIFACRWTGTTLLSLTPWRMRVCGSFSAMPTLVRLRQSSPRWSWPSPLTSVKRRAPGRWVSPGHSRLGSLMEWSIKFFYFWLFSIWKRLLVDLLNLKSKNGCPYSIFPSKKTRLKRFLGLQGCPPL